MPDTLAQVFSREFCDIFTEHLRATASILWKPAPILEMTQIVWTVLCDFFYTTCSVFSAQIASQLSQVCYHANFFI